MQDNQHTVPIEGNVRVKIMRGKMGILDDGLDNLGSLSALNLDLLRYIDKMKLHVSVVYI